MHLFSGGTGAFGNGDRAGHDEEADIDMSLFTRTEGGGGGKNKGVTAGSTDILKKQVAKVMHDKKKRDDVSANCPHCTGSHKFNHSLVVSKGEYVMLCMKSTGNSLIDNHLEIVPLSHISSINGADEETLKEVDRYKQCVTHMFEREFGQGVVFAETAINFERLPHAVVEVVPVGRGLEVDAKMFFKEVRVV